MPDISINQLAEFSKATDSAKKRIIKQQINPNKLLIPWYQEAKGAIKRYLANVHTKDPLKAAISSISTKIPKNKRQECDQQVSIESLKKIYALDVPRLMSIIEYELVKPDTRKMSYGDVDIIVAPDVIIKATYRGKVIYGAVKIHISKTKPFEVGQAKYVSALLYNFLKKKVASKGDFVNPELCLCLDVFSNRFFPASENCDKEIEDIKRFCIEIKKIYDTLR